MKAHPQYINYFVDESGDGVLFDKRGQCLLETGKVQEHFILGFLLVNDYDSLNTKLTDLRIDLLKDPFFSSVPSMQHGAGKTAKFFHAKDDIPEVRWQVFKLLARHDVRFFAVIKSMKEVKKYVLSRNQRSPLYKYHPDELYDFTVRRLFKDRLHLADNIKITFARRGEKKSRSKNLAKQLSVASQRFAQEHNFENKSKILLKMKYSWESVGLQAADYFIWALQRVYAKGEDRYLEFIWDKVGVIIDMDDKREYPYGKYYTKKEPLTTAALP